MTFDDLKPGDVVRTTVIRKSGPAVRTVRVLNITGVNTAPGRKMAWCQVLTEADGEDLRSVQEWARPTVEYRDDQAVTFERAAA